MTWLFVILSFTTPWFRSIVHSGTDQNQFAMFWSDTGDVRKAIGVLLELAVGSATLVLAISFRILRIDQLTRTSAVWIFVHATLCFITAAVTGTSAILACVWLSDFYSVNLYAVGSDGSILPQPTLFVGFFFAVFAFAASFATFIYTLIVYYRKTKAIPSYHKGPVRQ